MKTLTATLLASVLLASPAIACMGKSASDYKPMTTAQAEPRTEDAISTFDPATKPVFEEQATEEVIQDVDLEIAE